MDSQGFYKYRDQELLYAPNYIEGPNLLLLSSEKDKYEYPVDGWIWFESEQQAKEEFNILD
jgi:hypothetical protein